MNILYKDSGYSALSHAVSGAKNVSVENVADFQIRSLSLIHKFKIVS
jgi:hypothetical protein